MHLGFTRFVWNFKEKCTAIIFRRFSRIFVSKQIRGTRPLPKCNFHGIYFALFVCRFIESMFWKCLWFLLLFFFCVLCRRLAFCLKPNDLYVQRFPERRSSRKRSGFRWSFTYFFYYFYLCVLFKWDRRPPFSGRVSYFPLFIWLFDASADSIQFERTLRKCDNKNMFLMYTCALFLLSFRCVPSIIQVTFAWHLRNIMYIVRITYRENGYVRNGSKYSQYTLIYNALY